jgi:uncharacterized protein YecE (DUF72 family)
MKNHAAIMSEEQTREEHRRMLLSNEEKANKANTWTGIRKKHIKENLLKMYVIQISAVLKLTDEEQNMLADILYIGFLLGHIDSKKIVLKTNRIETIDGLSFDPKTRIFYYTNPKKAGKTKASKPKKASTEKMDIFLKAWDAIIEKLSKKSDPNFVFVDNDMPIVSEAVAASGAFISLTSPTPTTTDVI